MKILLIAAEAVPFAKTGGLADVAGVLPKFLAQAGHDVRVVMPRYYDINRAPLSAVGGPLGVPMGIIGEQWCGVLEGRLPDSEVPVYFIDHEGYFGRKGLYNEPNGEGYPDNDNRFVFLSRAALELCRMIDFAPDVVHCNDWHTAVAPVFLNTHYRDDPWLGRAASVLTIHNMGYQGRFYSGLMDVLDIGWEHFNPNELEHFDQVNLLKGGINHCTLWNAVSPRYAKEIMSPEFGHGLDGVARRRASELHGILNGIDYAEWDPANDPYTAALYSAEDLSGKAQCKAALQQEMGLPVRDDVPVIGIITRLVHQKGIDLIAACLPRILDLDVQFVLLGSGARWAHDYFGAMANSGRANFACHLGYSNALAHRIEAGSDLYLMPSRFEPCGLNQLYSLRYGTLPIVHATGGLDDTVVNHVEGTDHGTGFKLYDLHPQAVFDTVGWAVHTWYEHPARFRAMQVRGMEQRFSWERSAARYEEMYQEAMLRRCGA
jgi:starch synthase